MVQSVLVLFALAVGIWGQQPPRDTDASLRVTGSIGGRVVVLDSNPAKPVRRARVTLQSDRLAEPEFTDTDIQGRYQFRGLPPGAYRVTAEKPGFVTLEFGATRPFVRPPPLDLTAGQSAIADFALPRGAALEGRLRNEEGDPLQNIVVNVLRHRYRPAGRRPVAMGQATTDDTGRFRIHSLPPGEYYLAAAADPLRAMVYPGQPGRGYARTYYPGTPRVDDARSVRLETGQDVAGLDYALTYVPLAQVMVQVRDSAGGLPGALSARFQPVAGPVINAPGIGAPDKGGAQYRNVPPGEYWLTVAVVPSGGDPEFAARRITVEGQNIADVAIRTERGAKIAGRVEIDGGETAPELRSTHVVAHELEFELPNPGGAAAPVPRVTIARDLTFTIPNLFGPRLLRLESLPAGWALKTVYLDDTDISDVATDFRASAAPSVVRMVITNKTAGITGSVIGQRKQRIGSARVVVFPEDESRWTWQGRHVRTSVSSPEGTFSIEGLLAGSYLAAAVPYLEDEAWNDRDVLRILRGVATKVSLSEGEKAGMNLTLRALQ